MSEHGTASYKNEKDLPKIVSEAVALADSLGFEFSCLPGHGRLLQTIARGRKGARIGEIGTGCGVGIAWLLSGADETSTIVSIEIDKACTAGVAQMFKDRPNVEILCASWEAIYDHGPFDILILDGGNAGKGGKAELGKLLKKGGALIIDDFSINNDWPRKYAGNETDESRMFWLKHPELLCTEIRTDDRMIAIVGMRV